MVKATEWTVAEALAGEKQYQVPLFQRVYSWGKPQIDQLWDDVVELARARSKERRERGPEQLREQPLATHFIGSLVVALSPDYSAVGLSKLLVVDGQQRLMTVTLLLAALRDHLIECGDHESAEGIEAKYLINLHTKDRPTKVLPTRADRDAYLAVIRRRANAGGADSVGEAYNRFRALIAAVDDPDDPDDLTEIENAVAHGLAVVFVQAQAGDNPHRIFESLNNRGLQLNQSDLLKNYLFMRLGERADEVYDEVWLPLEKTLDTDELELLFWLDLVQRDERARQSATYSGQQKRLDRLPASQIESEIRRIAGLGELLATIVRPQREPDPELRLRLERLRAWGTTTAYPVVLRLLDRRAQGEATRDEVVRALTWLESFFIRRLVIGRATAGINRALLQAIPAISDAPAVDVALHNYLSRGRRFFATDAQVREAVRTVPFYWQGRQQQKKLVLQWLEDAFAGIEAKDTSPLTIEHVLPQTLTGLARAEFAVGLPEGADVEAEHERVLHTLGNLTLTAFNSALSNKPFSAKREAFENSGLQMNHDIAKHARWDPGAIAARGAALADKIVALWPGPNEALIGSSARDDSSLRDAVTTIVAQIPAGRWTSYGEIAVAVGSFPQPVAAVLSGSLIPGAWRVLQSSGTISPGFSWGDQERTDDPYDVLAAEGLELDDDSRASQAQFLTAVELADLAGLDVDPAELETRRSARAAGAPRDKTRGDAHGAFWQRVIEVAAEHPGVVKPRQAPSHKYWMSVGLGTPAARLELTVHAREPQHATCGFAIRDDKALFDRLEARRDDIESALGEPAIWDRGDWRKSRVYVQHDGDFRDPADAARLATWLVTTANRFAEVFTPYLG